MTKTVDVWMDDLTDEQIEGAMVEHFGPLNTRLVQGDSRKNLESLYLSKMIRVPLSVLKGGAHGTRRND